MAELEFAGQVALVTGGSSGIGAATVKAFCKAGAAVVIADILDAEGKIEEGFNDISQEEKSRFCSLLIELLRHELLPEPSGRERRNLGCRLIYTMIYDFYWLRFIESAEGLMNASHLERYHRIVKYIQEHYAERISLDDIVAGEDGTKAYFSQFLKTFTNNSFTRRVNYERIIKSEFMLLSGHPVLKISGLCGFSDGKYFSIPS